MVGSIAATELENEGASASEPGLEVSAGARAEKVAQPGISAETAPAEVEACHTSCEYLSHEARGAHGKSARHARAHKRCMVMVVMLSCVGGPGMPASNCGFWFKLRRWPPATGVASCGTARLM